MTGGSSSSGGLVAWIERARTRLATPVDGAVLVWFRVAFGLMVAWEMGRYIYYDWVGRYWVEPQVLFPYPPLTFVRPWPLPWMMYAHAGLVCVSALAVAAGWRYRQSSIVLFVSFTWLFLLDSTRYLNHFYLISLLAFVAMWLPLGQLCSLDSRAGRVARTSEVPTWSLWWVRFMVAVPYVYGGIAKLSSDWMSGYPMRGWLAGATDQPHLSQFFDSGLALAVFVWGGLLFDLLIVPLLLWRRSRAIGLGLMLMFHLSNSWMFEIGVFPWMMMMLTLVLLPADWPRRVWEDVREARSPALALAAGAIAGFTIGSTLSERPAPFEAVVAAIGVGIFFWEVAAYGWDSGRSTAPAAEVPAAPPVPVGAVGFGCGVVFVAVQLLLPLRHALIPGEVGWTEEGHRWSWRMLLRDKKLVAMRFVVDPPGDAPPLQVDPADHLLPHQLRKVAFSPEATVMFARYLVDTLEVPGAAVYVRSRIVLNGREPQAMIDPDQDLTQITVPWMPPAPWILPLREPLPRVATRAATEDD
jgi:vitamin K-dependent gamma-carboxylase